MNIPMIAAKNVLRNKLRTVLTVAGVFVAILLFLLLRTVVWSWNAATEYSAQDRLASRNKISFVVPLPRNYVDKVRAIPGVTAVTWMNWFGAKDPKNEQDFFATFASDPASLRLVYTELVVSDEEFAAWSADKQGALVGVALAKRKGWKVGDKITLLGTIFPGDWTFTIRGTYDLSKSSFDKSSFFFHWNYLNDSMPEGPRRDQIGWLSIKVANADTGTSVGAAIDKVFEDADAQTLTQSELQMNRGFMAGFSAILTAMDVVSLVILFIMMLILGNTIAMGVRERTREYGVLRALGFLPRHVLLFVLSEAVTIGLIGGGLAVLVGYPMINGMGKYIEENMGNFFPYFELPGSAAVGGLLLAVGLGTIASVIPAIRASRLSVIDSLRQVG
jgi:putative ABC transport system permease protein